LKQALFKTQFIRTANRVQPNTPKKEKPQA